MKKRTLLICLCAVLLLVIANAVAVGFLYSPVKEERAELASGDADTTAINGVTDSATAKAAASTLAAAAETAKLSLSESSAEMQEAETAAIPETEVAVPEGPFEVRNCGTGKINSISQREDFSLEMKDEKGAVLWTYALPGKICGRIAQIDYYANRKIQYLPSGLILGWQTERAE